MCGIAGIIGNLAGKELLHKMLMAQQHRGPDFTGTWFDNHVALGHNRLSIIDLSSAANQPFLSDDGRYILVFNGEIYNYLEIRKGLEKSFDFRTSSDTEVLLAAYLTWGEDCLHRFNGMFSFVIWDNKNKSLFAARDRFGVKPFYFSQVENSFVFASEIPTLWQAGVPKLKNEKVWASFFMYGSYGMPNESFWSGIHQLPAGYSLTLNNSKYVTKRWYNFEERVKKLQSQSKSEREEKEHILELLNRAVHLRFRADVPVGFNLSGGLDSSMLLALVHHEFPNNEAIEAFTFYTGDDRYDETNWVELMLKECLFPLNKCLLTKADFTQAAEAMARYQVEPYGGVPTVAYANVFKSAREKGVLVLLDGQGSDEAWAGYDYYLNDSKSVVQGSTSSALRPNVLSKEFAEKATRPAYPKPFDDELLDKQFRDLFFTKIPRALRFNDRVSMLHSTELREPFLDHNLVEYVFSRSKSFKIKNGVQKWFLRDIASDYLGEEITLAPKRPLQTPQREWLGKDLQDWTVAQLKKLEGNTWFDVKELNIEIENYMNGDQENSFFLWQWVNTAMIDG